MAVSRSVKETMEAAVQGSKRQWEWWLAATHTSDTERELALTKLGLCNEALSFLCDLETT